jgi:signal transduction histidine kinase/CheY-like chemotaxis protein
MKNLKIKSKLILLFILIKIIPLLVVSYIAIEGARNLNNYFESSTKNTFDKSKNIIKQTATTSISNSIEALDDKSQSTLERLSFEIANNIAAFLYERDKDLLFLSSITLNDTVLKEFYKIKTATVSEHVEYFYNEQKQIWEPAIKNEKQNIKIKANLDDNQRKFNLNQVQNLQYKNLPLYKEIQVIDLNGNEIYKVSSINSKKINIQNKEETYCKAEEYFDELTKLKKGELYVSNVIGAYVNSNIIGTFTKEKAKKLNQEFTPNKSAYAGKENPVGKRFEGIIRFATPIHKNGEKIGYVAFALDHRHIMEFTDSFDPLEKNTRLDIADASSGNYAFMWDYEGRNISHPRDYFIVGYDKNTGKKIPGWISADVAKKFNNSTYDDLGEFLETYPKFEEQSLLKKPNLSQLKNKGEVGLDCRYLNFAPQCEGWMQLTQDGGYGSFVIFWSNVWKLTTAATIPYYSGQYSSTKRGFGFVTIGANVDEFHQAANKTKENLKNILDIQVKNMKKELDENKFNVIEYIHKLIQELTLITLLMVIAIVAIALWMSNFLTNKISNLIIGTKEYSKHNFNHKIKITSKDEIGELESSFNDMADEIKELITKQKKSNQLLDEKVKELDAASRVKSDFLASMSHEIRTPLNAVLGFIEILQEKETDEEKLEYLKIVNSSGYNLLLIINDILDFSKIESHKLLIEYKKVNPYDKFIEISNQFKANAQNKNIKLETDISKELSKCIQLDILRVNQVISNLLSNAIKFTPHNGEVKLSISYEESINSLLICVEDNGIGIPKHKQKSIFNPFEQGDNSTTRKYGGTGLGLTISSKLVSLMGGELKLDSSRDIGSKFYFNIPLKSCKECDVPNFKSKKTVNNNEIKSFAKENISILIVEDNKANQMFMQVLMKNLALEYKIVNDGLEAVQIYKQEKFNLILMDENMPVMSGSEATKQIREFEKKNNQYTPIVALTANALEGDRERFLDVGMDDYLSKPLKKTELIEVISKYIDIKQTG